MGGYLSLYIARRCARCSCCGAPEQAPDQTAALREAITAALPLLARVNADGGAQQVRLNEATKLLSAAIAGTGKQEGAGE